MKRFYLVLSLVATALLCYRAFFKSDENTRISMPVKIPGFSLKSLTLSRRPVVPRGRRDILIISYMRSGSTITGHLLGHREDAFYFYEPFWADLTHSYLRENDEVCNYINPTCRQMKGVVHKALDFMQEIFSCSFNSSAYLKRMFTIANSDFVAKRSGRRWDSFINCKHRHKNNTFDDCVKHLMSTCRDAKHRVSKVLRLSINSTELLLREDSKLIIVYLLRDPRGIITSQMKTKWFPFTGKTQHSLSDSAKALCTRMAADIVAAKRLLQLYPNRVNVILYEEFGNKARIVRELYDFAGMDYNKTFIETIANTTDTSAATTASDGFHPYIYRSYLTWDTVKTIDKACSEVYSAMGYPQFETENDLRNSVIDDVHN